jgi:ATP-dependent Clp protease ATP-binding subunit ClpC
MASLSPRSPLTRRAQRLLRLAGQQAQRLHHSRVAPEHLLLGILALNEGTAVEILKALDGGLTKLRMELEHHASVGRSRWSGEALLIPSDERVQRIWQQATAIARELGQAPIGTGHVLWGMLAQYDSLPAQLLVRRNVSLPRVERQLITRHAAASASHHTLH